MLEGRAYIIIFKLRITIAIRHQYRASLEEGTANRVWEFVSRWERHDSEIQNLFNLRTKSTSEVLQSHATSHHTPR